MDQEVKKKEELPVEPEQNEIAENPKKMEEESQSSSSESSRSESKKRKRFRKSSSSASVSRSRSRSKSKSKASQAKEKSNKSQSKSKSPSKSKSNTHSPSRSSQSRSNHQKIDTKNSSPNKRFNNRRVSDNDIGNNTWDKERRGNYYMGRDKPYFKRREDNRFKPYKRHDDDSKSRSSSGGNNYSRSKKSKNPKQIYVPYLDGPLVSYRVFMESQPDNVDRNKAEKFYEKYKKDWERKQLEIFFGEHKAEEWFAEKYDPILSDRLKEERRNESQKNAERFFENHVNGIYDNLNLEIDEETLNSHINKDINNTDKLEENNGDDNNIGGSARINFHKEINLDDNVDILGEPYFGFDPNCMTLFIKSVPKNISRWDIKDNLMKVAGFSSLSLSEPLKTHDFLRFGWILFDSEENCNKGAYTLNNLMIKNYAFTIVKSKGQKKPIKVSTKLDTERIKIDIELCKELIVALDKEKGIENNKLVNNISNKSIVYQLDILTLYLRKVHSYCLYCAAEYYDERMLSAKCGPQHLRLKIDPEIIHNIPDWHAQCNEIVKSRIKDSKNNVEKKKNLTEEIEEDLDEHLRKQIKKEVQDEKWPCLFCDKMFQGEQFVFKHFKNKHESQLMDEKKKVIENKMLKAYINDKNKIKGGNYNMGPPGMFPSSGMPSHHYQYKGGHHYNNRKGGPRKFYNKDDKPFYKKPNYEEGQPYKKFPHKEYKDLDDPSKNTEQVAKNVALINYNDI